MKRAMRFWLVTLFFAVPALARADAPVPSEPQNILSSPIADAFIANAAAALHGSSERIEALREECSAGAESTGNDQSLVNDLQIVGAVGPRASKTLAYGAACRVLVRHTAGEGVVIVSESRFRDSWGPLFDPRNTAPAPWTMSHGTVLQVPMMHNPHALVGIAPDAGLTVTTIGFRDAQFALFLVTGPGISPERAHRYFSSSAFRNREGYRSALVALSIPRVALHMDRVDCMRSCAAITIRKSIRLAISEFGLGDAPNIPLAKSELRPRSLSPPYAPCCRPPVAGSPIAADRPFYVAIIDVQTQRILFDAFVERPTLR